MAIKEGSKGGAPSVPAPERLTSSVYSEPETKPDFTPTGLTDEDVRKNTSAEDKKEAAKQRKEEKDKEDKAEADKKAKAASARKDRA